MNWQMVTALLTGVGLLCGAGIFAVRAIVNQALDEKLRLFDERYANKALTEERHSSHERRIATLEVHGQ